MNKKDVDPLEVGRRIRDIRSSLGVSMEEFATRIDQKAKSGTVSNWETGKNLPNNERLKRIAELGNTTVDKLLYGEKESMYDLDKLKQIIVNTTFVSFQNNAFSNLVDTLNEADFLSFGIADIISIYSHNVSHENHQIDGLQTLLDYYKDKYEGLNEYIEHNHDANPDMLEDLSIELYSLQHQINEIEKHLNN